VIEAAHDRFVKPVHARRLAATIFHARLVIDLIERP